jgi:hypothetical protein
MYTHALLTQTSWQHCNSIGFAGTPFTFRWLKRGRRSFVPSSEMSARRRTAAGGDDTQISAEIRAPTAVACGHTATATGHSALNDLHHGDGDSAGTGAAANGLGALTTSDLTADGSVEFDGEDRSWIDQWVEDSGDAAG